MIERVFRPGQAINLPEKMNDPSARFVRVHAMDVFALMGLESVSYSKADIVNLRFDSLEHAQLGHAAIKDSVLGAKLVFTDVSGKPIDLTTPYSGSPTNVARSVAAMPGVLGYRWFGSDSYLLTPNSLETRVRLQQLVNRKFGSHMAFWQGECFGPKCPIDPPPPDGTVPEVVK